MFQWKAKARCDFAHVQDDVNPHILRIFEGTVSLEEAHHLRRLSINVYKLHVYASLLVTGFLGVSIIMTVIVQTAIMT